MMVFAVGTDQRYTHASFSRIEVFSPFVVALASFGISNFRARTLPARMMISWVSAKAVRWSRARVKRVREVRMGGVISILIFHQTRLI